MTHPYKGVNMKKIAYIASSGADSVPVDVVSTGFQVDLVAPIGAPFPSDPVHRMLADVSTVEAAIRAERSGYDGVLIGAVADYGIEQIRSAIKIPAIGSGQASMLTAVSLGRRFGIVTIWPQSQEFAYQNLLRDNGLRDRCTGVRYVTAGSELATLQNEDNFYTRMRAGREDMITRIVEQIQGAIDDGADTIVLGCNCMTSVASILAEKVDVPVIDPTTTGYKFLELIIALGLAPSATAYPRTVSDRSDVFATLARVAGEVIDAEGPDECAVCVLADDGTASCTVEAQ